MPEVTIAKEELVRHVTDSFWLDLAYDEENRKILTDRGFDQLSETAAKERIIPPLPSDANQADPSYWFDHFKKLKLIRVLDGLDLDDASRDYADSSVDPMTGQFQQQQFEVLRKRASKRRQNLDTITWRCSAAIDRILLYYNSKAEAEESERSPWATLLALYHSELCASASPEVSFGWARRHGFVLKKEAVGSSIFRWVADHNVSRGYNHLHHPLNAVKGLDNHVDVFQCEELSKELADQPEEGNVNLLYRLLYLPAILTLAQSLGDLQRHSERRYYLKKGQAISTEKPCFEYWKELFSLHLSLAHIDTGFWAPVSGDSESESITRDLPPRTKQLSKLEGNQAAELRMKVHFRGEQPVLSDKILEDWRHTTAWMLRWHSAETHGFHRRLQATAQFLVELLKVAKKSAKRNAAKESFSDSNEQMMAIAIRVLIETHRFMGFLISDRGLSAAESKSLKCLLDPGAPREVRDDLPEIWRSGSRLLRCLNTLNEVSKMLNDSDDSQEMQELRGWRMILEKALDWAEAKTPGKKTIDHHFRSEVEHLELFPYATPHDRFCPWPVVSTPCGDRCAQRAWKFGVASPQVANYKAYKCAMYSQQRRFLDYLKFRTAKERSYRAGEAPVKSPNFELISLRRWNSFSPNLGSRAAVSVGGGYLIRLWHQRRYLGIAVDPGYNFLENLFNEGFTIADIDIVVVTHAHPDHTENLTNLFTLLFERNKRMADEKEDEESNGISAPSDHRVFLLLTEGVFERYASMMPETKTYVRGVAVLKAAEWRGSEASAGAVRVRTDEQWNCCIELDGNIKDGVIKREDCVAVIQAKRAWHDDQTGHDSIGIVVTYWGEIDQPKVVGVLGDSKYHKELYLDYKDCSVLVSHLGSLISKSYYKSRENNEDIKPEDYVKMIIEEDHLYLPGLTRLICDFKNRNKDFPLLVLSEFGEELRGGLRKDLANRLAYGVQNMRLPIVPADVGLRIDIESKRIFCSVCHRYLAWEAITVESVLPNEEALAFVCDDCRLLRAGELTKLLEDWCTTGRPVIRLKVDRGSTGFPGGPAERQPPLQS